jgi:nicotinate-nucleotide adenylyltransferase
LLLARALIDSGKIEQIIFVPTAISPLKVDRIVTPAHHRLAMLKLAIADHPRWYISDYELQQPGISYTINTAVHFAREFSERLYIIIGADCMRDLHLWKQANILVTDFKFIIFRRPDYQIPDEAELTRHFSRDIARKLLASVWESPLSTISATAIRQCFAHHESIIDETPKSVVDYIHHHRLYLV